MTNKCPDCYRRIPEGRIKCLCGWSPLAASAVHMRGPDCAHAECQSSALVRVYTPTGWANLCPEHYAKSEIYKRPPSMSPTCVEIREAYQKKIASGAEQPLDIPEDALEAELRRAA